MKMTTKKIGAGLLTSVLIMGATVGSLVGGGNQEIDGRSRLEDGASTSSLLSTVESTGNIFQSGGWTKSDNSDDNADFGDVWTKKFTRESDSKEIEFTIEANKDTSKFRVGRYNDNLYHYVWTKDLDHPLEEREGTADALTKAETAIKESLKVVVRLRANDKGFVVFKYGDSKETTKKYFDNVKGNTSKNHNKLTDGTAIDTLIAEENSGGVYDNEKMLKKIKEYAISQHTQDEETPTPE